MRKIAIAGNPNSGKTCLFNSLTGGNQRVGNYPGVTVEFVEGFTSINGKKNRVVDLPGTYSLTAYSQEELVAREYIINKSPDVVVNVIDASNLERNLYFTSQLVELNIPMVLAVNMLEIAEKKGITVDLKRLSELTGMKVVRITANRGMGMEELKKACLETIEKHILPKPIAYSHELQNILPRLEEMVSGSAELCGRFPARWVALKLLEDDSHLLEKVWRIEGGEKILKALESSRHELLDHSNEDAVTAVAEARYGFASGLSREVAVMTDVGKQQVSDIIDRIVCNRVLGPLVMCGIVYLLFLFTFGLAEELKWLPDFNGGWLSPTEMCELFFAKLSSLAKMTISVPWLLSMVDEGIISGVGGVMSFVPLIFFMFFFIAVLEDTGYIARVAFIMDRLLRVFGLQGKSVLALIVSGGLGGGGCAVPGVMATRTLRDEKDRILTVIAAPFMNCGAKMPVYAMLIAAFFSSSQGAMMFLLWLLSWAFALFSAWMMRKIVFKGEQTPFVMELPVYHVPTLKGVFLDAWGRTCMYMKKAATIILAMNVILWALMYYPGVDSTRFDAARAAAEGNQEMLVKIDNDEALARLENSFAGRIGRAMTPVTHLAGFDWRENIALIGGMAAKEVVLGTMGTAYAMGSDGAEENLPQLLASQPDWNKLRAFALLVFIMGYAPCAATLVAIKKETGKWRWTIFSAVYSTVLAFVVSVVIYQVGQVFFH